MTSAEGYELDPNALKQVTKGIHDAIAELKELGFDTNAQLGQGFDKLALSGMESGHRRHEFRLGFVLRTLGLGRSPAHP